MLLAGCSSSSSDSDATSQQNAEQSSVSTIDQNTQTSSTEDSTNSETSNGNVSLGDDNGNDNENSAILSATQVDFDITVPAYVSNELLVQLTWSEQTLTAAWVQDELWRVSASLPTNTEHLLTVTFFDGNGALTLASFQGIYRTGSNASETYPIRGDQFETAQWDNDNDGISNFDEARAGSNPSSTELTEPAQANLELIADKTYRLTWESVEGAQFYRVLENIDGVSGFNPVSEELNSTTRQFDHRVAIYKRLNASYILQACTDSICIDSALLHVPETIANAIGYFKASNTDPGDLFGGAVSLSADGNTLAVGAIAEASNTTLINGDENNNRFLGAHSRTTGPGAGAVYLFQRTDGVWEQQAYIKPRDHGPSDQFGGSVALSADGRTLVVGAEYADLFVTNSFPFTNRDTGVIGAAYVFRRSSEGSWWQEAKLKPQFDDIDFFGDKVDVSENGRHIIVMDRRQNLHVYERVNGQLSFHSNLSNEFGDDCYAGVSAAISDDGNTIVIGHDDGHARVYAFENDVWNLQTCLKPSNPNVAEDFGRDLSISADGNTLAVAARMDGSEGSGINSSEERGEVIETGAVFMYSRTNNVWRQSAYIKSDTPDSQDRFGGAIALSADATTLVATSSDGLLTYEQSDGVWSLVSLFKRGPASFMGFPLSISADGNTLAAGFSRENSAATGINGFREDASATNAGAVFLY